MTSKPPPEPDADASTAPDTSRELLRLAQRVADGEAVDWQTETASTLGDAEGDGESAGWLGALRDIAAVASAHRRLQRGEPLRAEASEASVLLGRWGTLELLAPLGAGASAQVYRARDPALDREVALKLLTVGEGSRARAEGRLLARLQHPHIATVHGIAEHPVEGLAVEAEPGREANAAAEPRLGLTMELVDGETLHAHVRRAGPLAPRSAARLAADLASALDCVHQTGLVHGDVKAQNVLLEADTDRAVLVDFGVGRELQAAGRPAGTPLYLAPEVLQGHAAEPPADVYSLGVLLFFLLTGEHPFAAPSLDGLRKLHASPRPLVRELTPQIPPELAEVLDACLVVDPDERPEAGELEESLRGIADPPRRRWVLGSIVVGVLVLLSLSLWGWARSAEREVERARKAYSEEEIDIFATITLMHVGLKKWPFQPVGWAQLSGFCSAVSDAECALDASEEAYRLAWLASVEERSEIFQQHALQRGRFRQSVARLEQLAEQRPEDPYLLRNLALSYLVTGQLDEAGEVANLAMEAESANREETNQEFDSVKTAGILALVTAYTDPIAAMKALEEIESNYSSQEDPHPNLAYLDWPRCLSSFVAGEPEEAEMVCGRLAANRYYASVGSFFLAQVTYGRDGSDSALRELRFQQQADAVKNRLGDLLRKKQFQILHDYLQAGEADPEQMDELDELLDRVLNLPVYARRGRTIALSYVRIGETDRARITLQKLRALELAFAGSPGSQDDPDLVIAMARQVEAELALVAGDLVGARRLLQQAESAGFTDAVMEFTYLELARREGDVRAEAAALQKLQTMCVTLLQDEPIPLFELQGVDLMTCFGSDLLELRGV